MVGVLYSQYKVLREDEKNIDFGIMGTNDQRQVLFALYNHNPTKVSTLGLSFFKIQFHIETTVMPMTSFVLLAKIASRNVLKHLSFVKCFIHLVLQVL